MSEESMLKFVDRRQSLPPKRKPQERIGDFGEIYDEYSDRNARHQAARCSQCGVPFCQIHCPLHNNIPDWLYLTEAGRLQEAYQVSSATNSFPEICGRICPQDRLCEGSCVIEQAGHDTVTIGAVEKYITDTAWEKGWVQPIRPPRQRPQSVAIIGAGPAGLAAAEKLRWQGYKVVVYDRYDRIGGLLVYGIPNFKLDKDIVARRANWLQDGGIEFRLNCDVGKDISWQDLRSQHDAVLIATGVYKARDFHRDEADFKRKKLHYKGILAALDYLTVSNRTGLGDKISADQKAKFNAKGKHVVVIGGGDTAMDCVRTAVRQKAASVTCLYRRDRDNMPGSKREVKHAEEEGVKFSWLTAPRCFLGDDKNLQAVLVSRMRLGSKDLAGRREPVVIEGADYGIPCDMAILALGFEAEDLRAQFSAQDLPVTRWGTIACTDGLGATSMDGVFAAGDIVRGASLVVWAIRDGQDSAAAIHRYIQTKAALKPTASTVGGVAA